ncbi:MAG TPA: acetate--CoA ligase family protein, partial [Burkholderiales bacterium]|nr:acetate--CoA ligase family protein [Burkholderiales bacterium]
EVFNGVIRGAGLLRARNEEHMLDMVEVLSKCARPEGRGLGIVTQSGGAGVLMTDRAEEIGLSVPMLSDTTQRRLRSVIPSFGATGNPVDITGQFIAEPSLLYEAVRAVLADPDVHAGVVWLQLMDAYVDTLVGVFARLKAGTAKPFVVCWVAAPSEAVQALRERGIAVLRGAEPAVDAVGALVQYANARRQWHADSEPRKALRNASVAPIEGASAGVVSSTMTEDWLNACGVATVPARIARAADQAVAAASDLGYPVALKIASPDILHRTEIDAVELGLANAEAVRKAYGTILSNTRRSRPDARIDGVAVQRMAERGVELVVGLKRDQVFGVIIMVGLGGIHVEVLKDAVFRAAPVTPSEAGRMLDELRGRAILEGVRGQAPVNRRALVQLISAVSVFGATAGTRLRELDLNPVIANDKGAVAVDWLLLMD